MKIRWPDEAAKGWELLSWNGEAQWFAKRQDGWTTGGRLTSLDQLIRSISAAEALHWNFYLNLNPTQLCGKYASRRDVTRWRYACLDLDPPGDADMGKVGPHAAAEPAPPWNHGAKVFTGRGYQFWLPIQDMPEPYDWSEQYMRSLLKSTEVEGWKVDPTTSDLPRRVRCPGSINQRTGARAAVLSLPTGGICPTEPPREEVQPAVAQPLGENFSKNDILPHLRVRNMKAFVFLTEGWEHPGRHSALYTLIKTLHEMGVDANRALRYGMEGALLCRPKPLHAKDVVRDVRQVYGRQHEH